VLKNFKRNFMKMFRELLVYHHSSLEYRAKILTLMISSNGDISECEAKKLQEISKNIYRNDEERAALLIDTVNEYHTKIVTNNELDFEHLIQLVERETRDVPRFVEKIDISLVMQLHECTQDEEETLFQQRIIEFLETLIDEYKKV